MRLEDLGDSGGSGDQSEREAKSLRSLQSRYWAWCESTSAWSAAATICTYRRREQPFPEFRVRGRGEREGDSEKCTAEGKIGIVCGSCGRPPSRLEAVENCPLMLEWGQKQTGRVAALGSARSQQLGADWIDYLLAEHLEALFQVLFFAIFRHLVLQVVVPEPLPSNLCIGERAGMLS